MANSAPEMPPVNYARSYGPILIVLVLIVLASVALAGCAARPSAPPVVGVWRGSVVSAGLSLPSEWELRGDGSQSMTLTLPQGLLTSQGTWTFHNSALTFRTTSRAITLGGEQKTMPLVNPLETTYGCRVSGDTLTLRQSETHETITLTREKPE